MVTFFPKVIFFLLIFVFTFGSNAPFQAQDNPPPDSESVELGTILTGDITNARPRVVYTFEGRRGEVIHLQLSVTSGNLDPILLIFNNQGKIILKRDDTQGRRDVDYTLTLESNELFYIVVARFGQTLGTTSGSFELRLERIGVISAAGSTLRYGDSVQNTITNMQPQVYYTFEAQQGDIINIRMVRNSGTLDPYIQVVNSNADVIADNDDVPGSNNNNAYIEGLVIEQSGTYIIISSRYGQVAGNSVGNFVLTIEESRNSGLGNSTLAPQLINMNQTLEGSLNAERFERFYTFNARRDDLITIKMERISGQLDTYLVLANAGLQPLLEDDDGGNGKNSTINDYRIPADGTYYIIATRFDRANGTTVGDYRLQLESGGNAFSEVPPSMVRLEYGTTTTGNLGDVIPEVIYAFWGNREDIITASLSRGDGNLDPAIELYDNQQRRLVRDDDSGGNQNARIERYTLPYTGIYYLRATRYDGVNGNPNTQGSFILVLARRLD